MLDQKLMIFDKFNVWRKLWYYPTHRELYILNSDGEVAAKWHITKRTGEWPMWIVTCIVNTLPIDKKAAIDTIVNAWGSRVFDYLVDTEPRASHRHSAILD